MNFHYPACRVVVSGVTETGKTTFCQRYTEAAVFRRKKVAIIFDWQDGEFSQRLGCRPFFNLIDLADAYDKGEKFLPYIPSEDTAEEFDTLCEWILSANSNCEKEPLLVADELGQIFNHGKLPQFVKRALVAGRRIAQLDILWSCHQLNEVHFSMRNHVTEIACFRQNDDLAVEAAESFGIPRDVRELMTGEYYYRHLKKFTPATKQKLFSCQVRKEGRSLKSSEENSPGGDDSDDAT